MIDNQDKKLALLGKLTLNRPMLFRTVNLHNTPEYNRDFFERMVREYSEKYCPVTLEDVERYAETGVWDKPKPGIVFALFEGYRNNYDVFYPILEKYHMTGWFFLIADFFDTPETQQRDFAEHHDIDPCLRNDHHYGYPGEDRIALSFDEIREIAKKHVIVCHTARHLTMEDSDSEEWLRYEIIDAKKKLERELGKEVKVYCSLWGRGYEYSEKIARLLLEAGYEYIWSAKAIERIRV